MPQYSWNFHQIRKTRYTSLKKLARPSAWLIFKLFQILSWGGSFYHPPVKNRVKLYIIQSVHEWFEPLISTIYFNVIYIKLNDMNNRFLYKEFESLVDALYFFLGQNLVNYIPVGKMFEKRSWRSTFLYCVVVQLHFSMDVFQIFCPLEYIFLDI